PYMGFLVRKICKVLEKELSKLCMNMDDLNMLLREQKVFSVNDVENAIFEANGSLSIMMKKEKQPVMRQDQTDLRMKPKYMPTNLVADGKVITKKLTR